MLMDHGLVHREVMLGQNWETWHFWCDQLCQYELETGEKISTEAFLKKLCGSQTVSCMGCDGVGQIGEAKCSLCSGSGFLRVPPDDVEVWLRKFAWYLTARHRLENPRFENMTFRQFLTLLPGWRTEAWSGVRVILWEIALRYFYDTADQEDAKKKAVALAEAQSPPGPSEIGENPETGSDESNSSPPLPASN